MKNLSVTLGSGFSFKISNPDENYLQFFYKNTLYKNTEAQTTQKLRTISEQ